MLVQCDQGNGFFLQSKVNKHEKPISRWSANIKRNNRCWVRENRLVEMCVFMCMSVCVCVCLHKSMWLDSRGVGEGDVGKKGDVVKQFLCQYLPKQSACIIIGSLYQSCGLKPHFYRVTEPCQVMDVTEPRGEQSGQIKKVCPTQVCVKSVLIKSSTKGHTRGQCSVRLPG